MKLSTQTPKKVLKALLKQAPLRSEIDIFKTELATLISHIDTQESEEFHKNLVIEFLKKAIYQNTYFINTKGRQDLVIHNGSDNKSSVGVIIEAKKPTNKTDWFTADKPNAKAIQELLLYYLRERIEADNIDLKYIVATNIYEWYIIEASHFERLFYRNKALVRQYEEWREGKKVSKNTDLFYNEIAKPFIDNLDEEVPCVYFNLKDYEKKLGDDSNDKELAALYKILSPAYLLKVAEANDSNALNAQFYKELLHIIGLEEEKSGGRLIINRKKNRNEASLLEQTILALNIEGLHKVSNLETYGESHEERVFNVALELCITWVNRLLFLKLLEGQLVHYHKGDKSYYFLNSDNINSFHELFKLFHRVLAVKVGERSKSLKSKYEKVPYLNSSLFEISELEDQTIRIYALDPTELLEFFSGTILKEEKKKVESLPTLTYFFKFLDAYDFGTEGKTDIREDNKPIINASVLGKVFEKINGYKDGSVFTPAFITMYMSREVMRLAVVQKFNEVKGWNCQNFDDLDDKIEDRKEANQIIDSLKICDPSVGSGHFLVSVLNEIIAIKSELKILEDEQGKRLKETFISIVDDELLITDEDGDLFVYNYHSKDSQRIQKTLFHEKQKLIENCLFGVDINPNSAKICRLRLWIELLKNAYYTEESEFTELETLPNIDINIKWGDSLISKFHLDDNFNRFDNARRQLIKKILPDYRRQVVLYKSVTDRVEKMNIINKINEYKAEFDKFFNPDDKDYKAWKQKENELITYSASAFPNSDIVEKLKQESQMLKDKYMGKTSFYKNAFEWRFDFPEILNEEGEFEGFDVVIGNPPYIQIQKLLEKQKALQMLNYQTYEKMGDMYCLFYEKAHDILKESGSLCYITSNKWLRASYGESMREYLVKNTLPILLYDLGADVFDNATVDTNILLFQKTKTPPIQEIEEQTVSFAQVKAATLPKGNREIATFIRKNAMIITKLNKEAWYISDSQTQQLKEKILSKGIPLKDWNISINFGIKTGYNEAFIIDEATKNRLTVNEDFENEDITKPLLRGRDIQKYNYDFANLYLICTFPNLKIDIENYPLIKEYLLSFGLERLEQSGKEGARKKTSNKWFEIQDNIAYWEDFNKEKVVWKRVGSLLRFAYVEAGVYCLDSTCFIAGGNAKYLCALLNSKVCNYQLFETAPKTGVGDLIISVQALEPISVPILSPEAQQPFIDLVDTILEKKQKGENTQTEETQIDQLVYQLYDLTPEEIALVEQGVGKA
jgi:type II restriction/modification system DNA methylase subunit YeeA